MSKKPADDFFNSVDYPGIIDTIKGVFTSDGSISTLIDFERVLDEADLYAYKNWDLGELVDGPEIGKYSVTCTFMYPNKLMPNPKGGTRLTNVGCTVHFKKTKIKVPIEIKDPSDFKSGTHYPKMAEREVWLVRIAMPKQLMNEIREGSIDLADQTIDLQDLDDAYEQDLDKEAEQEDMSETTMGAAPAPGPMPGAMPGAPA
jgi:hypothetical protein